MKLSDLKTGMRIKTRNNGEYIVLKNVITFFKGKVDMYVKKEGGFMTSTSYTQDMLNKGGNKEYDIVEVYAQNEDGYLNAEVLSGSLADFALIWTRKKLKKMTVSEICKELGYDVEIVKED